MTNKTLARVVTGAVRKREATLSVPDRHALKIARQTMRMHCAGAAIMGGPNHAQAVATIHKLTGAVAGLPADCTCR